MTKPALLVLAAGVGRRYGGLKQIDPIGPSDEILIDYAIFDAWRAGFGKVVFIVEAKLEDAFQARFSTLLADKLDVVCVRQRLEDVPPGFRVPAARKVPWGTGHAVWTARHVIDGPFAMLNADDFYGRESYCMLADFFRQSVDCSGPDGHAGSAPARCSKPMTGTAEDQLPTFCMVAFRLLNTLSEHGTVARGICTVDADGFLTDVVERTKIGYGSEGGVQFLAADGTQHPLTGEEPCSMNLWGFTPAIFASLGNEFG